MSASVKRRGAGEWERIPPLDVSLITDYDGSHLDYPTRGNSIQRDGPRTIPIPSQICFYAIPMCLGYTRGRGVGMGVGVRVGRLGGYGDHWHLELNCQQFPHHRHDRGAGI